VSPEGLALHIEGDVCIPARLVEGEQAPAWHHVTSADAKVNTLYTTAIGEVNLIKLLHCKPTPSKSCKCAIITCHTIPASV
jgi:hypothetical protein